MKTLTEFQSPLLKTAHSAHQEQKAAEKTPEEFTAAMGQALSLEGDKLNYLLGALEAMNGRIDGIKRIVVASLGENEKPPAGYKKVGELYFAVEYFPAPASSQKPAPARDDSRGNRKRDGKKGKGGGRPPRDRAPRRENTASAKPSTPGVPPVLPKPIVSAAKDA